MQEVETTTNTTAELLSSELLPRLDALAAKLGVATEHLWGVLVKQGTVEGAFGFVYVALGFGLLASAILLGYKGKGWMDDWDTDILGFFTVSAAVILTVFGIIGICIGIDTIKYLFNPEYFALHEVGKWLGK